MLEFYLFVLMPLFLILLGWIVGGARERQHIRDLDEFYRRNRCLVTEIKGFPEGAGPQYGATLINAEVVVAEDYFKTIVAGLRQIFGGELKSYQTLMSRARREVTARLIREAEAQGHDAVCNIRIDFVRIGLGFAVLASGTGYRRPQRGH